MGCTNSKGQPSVARETEYVEHVLHSRWTMGKELGRGAFSRVVLAHNKKDVDKWAAVKIMTLKHMKPEDVVSVKREVDILRKLKHRNIVGFYDFFDEDGEMFVVLEYLKGGELFTRLQKKEVYSEKDARDLVFVLLNALKHMHDMDIVHRDLKPENLLMASEKSDADVKIADFGFAAHAPEPTLTDACGTPAYVAPEVLNKIPHGKPADMWSLGVITYILLGGYAPFDGVDLHAMYKQIRAAKFKFHEDYWVDVSTSAKDFIRHLLVVDTSVRLTVDQALEHEWVKMAETDLVVKKLAKAMEGFRTFNSKRKLKGAMKAVVMVSRMKRFSLSSKASEDNDGLRSEGDVHLEGLGGSDAGEQPSTYVEHKFASRWLIGGKLGEGAFAEVHLCTSLKDHSRQCAVKILSKKKMKEDDHASVLREVEIMRKLQHPNIVQFLDYFDESGSIYIVEECLSGGELFDRIVKKEHYSEKEARDVVFYFLKGLQHCHSHGVVHRDLKPENLLLASKDDDENIKIADFGLSAMDNGGHLREKCGSPSYMAPEILLLKPYGKPVDMWALGVITYILLGGYPPFDQEDEASVKKCRYEFHADYWGHVSHHAKDFISGLLVLDPHRRLTVEQALEHEWVKMAATDLAGFNLAKSLERFKEFHAKRKLKAAMKAVVGINRLKNLLG